MYRWLRAVLFVTILTAVLMTMNSMMVTVNQRVEQWGLYESQPRGSVDVLIIGNSHVHCTFSPLEIWNTTGVTSWSFSQGLLNQRHKLAYLEQALISQKPKVVVVEVWPFDSPVRSTTEINQWAYSAMPFGGPKIRAIMETAGSTEGLQYIAPVLARHFPWDSFTRDSAERAINKLSGVGLVTGGAAVIVDKPTKNSDQHKRTVVKPNSIQYLEEVRSLIKIRDLCLREDIELLFCLSPMITIDASDAFGRLAKDIGPGGGSVSYVNMSEHAEDIGLSTRDYRDAGHLYLWGMKKASKWFADEVLTTYDLPDRRGTELASQWDEWYRQWELDTRYTSPVKASK